MLKNFKNLAVKGAVLFWVVGVAAGSAFAVNDPFEAILVPGAKCGDGSDYKIYFRKGPSNKVVIHFQGGGACWDYQTCYGSIPLTRLKEKVDFDKAPLTANQPKHPLRDFSYVFFPYCTGDVFTGTHEGQYQALRPMHFGRSNIEKALQVLHADPRTEISHAETVLVYGESAGALGAILNLNLIDPLVSPKAHRAFLADAPGLHFNSSIWKRFSSSYIGDMSLAMEQNGIRFDDQNGDIAVEMPSFCKTFSHWKIGVLQGSQDLVMSMVFGALSPSEHEKHVFGPKGIYEAFKDPLDQCASWTPITQEHTFLGKEGSRKIQTEDGTLPIQMLEEVLDSSHFGFESHR